MKHWKVSIWSVWRELGAYCSNRIYHFCYKYLILWYSYIFLDKTKDLIQTSELLDKVLTKKKKKTPVHNASVNYSCDQNPSAITKEDINWNGKSHIKKLIMVIYINCSMFYAIIKLSILFKASELKNVKKLVKQTVQALKCY